MIALAWFVVAILWLLTVVTGVRLVVPLRDVGKRRPWSFLAALFAALALTVLVPQVYVALDEVIGGRNLASLFENTCLILCSYFVARVLLDSMDVLSGRGRGFLLTTAVAALGVQTTAFIFIERRPTTADLMLASKDQLAALVYSLSHFLYLGIASAIIVLVAAGILRTQVGAVSRVAAVSLGVGGSAGVVSALIAVTRDTARYAGSMELEVLDPIWRVLMAVVAVGNGIGLGLPAVAGVVRRRRHLRVLRVLELAALRAEGQGWHPRIAVDLPPLRDSDLSDELTRAVIRLRDAQLFDRGIVLSAEEESALTLAERALHGRGKVPRAERSAGVR